MLNNVFDIIAPDSFMPFQFVFSDELNKSVLQSTHNDLSVYRLEVCKDAIGYTAAFWCSYPFEHVVFLDFLLSKRRLYHSFYKRVERYILQNSVVTVKE